MRPRLSVATSLTVAAFLGVASSAQAQISPSSYEATINIGQTISINKTVTLPPSGANLVDIMFLSDLTGSMSNEIAAVKSGVGAIMGAVPAGASYQFGAASYRSDPCELAGTCYPVGTSPAYALNQDLTTSELAVQAAVNTWTASGGYDIPEANFYALKRLAETATWRAGSQRIAVWFGDAPSHTETTTEAQAIAALNAKGVTVIAFNSAGNNSGIDGCYGSECNQADDIVAATGGSITHNFTATTGAALAAAVNSAISLATSTLDLAFSHNYAGTGLNISFACTSSSCDDVPGGETRSFRVDITGVEAGVHEFDVFVAGVSGSEHDKITVVDPSVVPEPSTWILLGTGMLGLGFMAWRRKEDEEVV